MSKITSTFVAVSICMQLVVTEPPSSGSFHTPTDQEPCQSTYSYNYSKYFVYTECRNVFLKPGQELPIYKQPNEAYYIVFKNSSLPTIPREAFTSFTNLTELYLNHNGVKTCDFNGLLNLHVLHLQDNNITKISKETFASLINLQILDLSRNSIASLEESCFVQLINLKFISLTRNKLYFLDPNTFVSQILLETLDLSHNYLFIYVFNLNSPYLKKLLINNNLLRHVSVDSIKNVHNLELFDVSFNILSKVGFASIINLKFANLSNNRISNITNWIDMLPAKDLPGNKTTGDIQSMYFDFKDFELFYSKIIHLDLSYNFIETIANNSFHGLVNLEVLLLNNNKIDYLSKGCFANLQSLKLLSLSRNSIKNLEVEIFDGLSMLTSLHLDNNKLSTITTTTFYGLTNLQTLYLNQNLLNTINEHNFLRQLPDLNAIYVTDNDWHCGKSVDITAVLRNYSTQLPEDTNTNTVHVFKIACNNFNITVTTSNMERKKQLSIIYIQIFLFFTFVTVFLYEIVIITHQYHRDKVIRSQAVSKMEQIRIAITRLEAIPVN